MSNATATKVSFKREALIPFYEELGWKTAAKWTNAKCLKQLIAVKDVTDSNKTYPEATSKILVDIAAGVESGAEFEVTGDESGATATTAAAGTVGTAGKSDEEKKADAQKAADDKAAKAAAKVKEKEDAKAAKVKEKEAAKAAKLAEKTAKKVSTSRGRGYYAGIVVKKHGFANGITDAMAAEVDSLYGTPNLDVSKGALKWAIDAIQGFQSSDNTNVGSGAEAASAE